MEQSTTAVMAVLKYRAIDAGWITAHTLSAITDISIEAVTDELEQLEAEGSITKRVNCSGGPTYVYHLVPKSPDLAKKIGALNELIGISNDQLTNTLQEIKTDLRLMHELGVGRG